MNRYVATVIRTGNSFALRVPKAYVEAGRLSVGDKAEVALPCKYKEPDRSRVLELLKAIQQARPYGQIKSPVAWQREIRRDRKLPKGH